MSVGTSRIDRDICFTLEVKSPKVFENIFLNNGVLCLMGSKGRVKLVTGSNRFDERVHLGQNPNTGFINKYASIATAYSDNWKTAEYGQAVIAGSAPLNFVDLDQNAGKSQISSLADGVLGELTETFPNKVADALMAATSGENDPLSIVEQLPATAYGSQTQTTGGIVRSDYPGTDRTKAWQTQYSNDSADISSAAGIATVTKFIWGSCSEGSALNMQPDICLTTVGVMAKASGGADVLRRYGTDDSMLKYGFDNIRIGNATFIADRNVGVNKAYFLNTNFMHVQVLGGSGTKSSQDVKVIGDGAVSVPLRFRPPVESDNKLEKIVKAYLVMNLTFGALKYHGLMDNLTEA